MPAQEATIPATDEGLLRGDGAFEVIRVYDGRPFALADHLDRLERSAANLRLDDVPRSELESEIPELLEARGGGEFDGCLRVVLTRGGRRLLLTEPLPATPERVRLGVRDLRADPRARRHQVALVRRATCSAAGSRASAASTRRCSSRRTGACSRRRPRRSSGSTRGGTLCTPPLDEHILASITRDRVMQSCVEVDGAALHAWTSCCEAQRGVPRLDHARGAVDRRDRGHRAAGGRAHARGARPPCGPGSRRSSAAG